MPRASRTSRPLALVLIIVALAIGALTPSAIAQGLVQVQLDEDPFVCDGGTRIIGTVDGFGAGEDVEFRSPQIDGGADGIFSVRTADDLGVVEMKWSCTAPKMWEVSVRGRASNLGATFTIVGVQAPPPPDAPLGAAFDAKSAMTASEMAIWKDVSPYNGVGIYIPVDSEWDNRADKVQANLTPQWVDAVLGDGWRILPIYVGRQAPRSCAIGSFDYMSLDPATARAQGAAAAADAARSMRTLGLAAGAPVYYNLESYRPGCSAAVLAFIDGWTQGLRSEGFASGVYGSQNSAMTDLTVAARTGSIAVPDAVWISTNSGVSGTLGLEAPPDDLWTNARIHQFRLNVTRTYGGVTLEVDDNIVDAPTAIFQPAVLDSDGDGHAEPEPDNCDGVANPDQADLDGDGDGDVCDSDRDGDGVDDPSPDNCDLVANPDQADLDGDGDGDACDGDIDGDFIANDDDPEPRDAAVPGGPTPTALPTATIVPSPTPADSVPVEPTTTATASPSATPPSATPLAVPTSDVIVLVPPTPDPTATPEPTPTALPAIDESATATVTVATEDDTSSPWRTVAIIATALAAVGSAGMAVRSWRNS
ncbi:MAG: glycoside hydrolase domain-containing protein [Actinomycetota bacterium]